MSDAVGHRHLLIGRPREFHRHRRNLQPAIALGHIGSEARPVNPHSRHRRGNRADHHLDGDSDTSAVAVADRHREGVGLVGGHSPSFPGVLTGGRGGSVGERPSACVDAYRAFGGRGRRAVGQGIAITVGPSHRSSHHSGAGVRGSHCRGPLRSGVFRADRDYYRNSCRTPFAVSDPDGEGVGGLGGRRPTLGRSMPRGGGRGVAEAAIGPDCHRPFGGRGRPAVGERIPVRIGGADRAGDHAARSVRGTDNRCPGHRCLVGLSGGADHHLDWDSDTPAVAVADRHREGVGLVGGHSPSLPCVLTGSSSRRVGERPGICVDADRAFCGRGRRAVGQGVAITVATRDLPSDCTCTGIRGTDTDRPSGGGVLRRDRDRQRPRDRRALGIGDRDRDGVGRRSGGGPSLGSGMSGGGRRGVGKHPRTSDRDFAPRRGRSPVGQPAALGVARLHRPYDRPLRGVRRTERHAADHGRLVSDRRSGPQRGGCRPHQLS